MSRPVYSIRFPLVIERTRVGRRIRKRQVADATGLHGARACAAGMITIAISEREDRPWTLCRNPALYCRMMRLRMRVSALWARVFAGHIESTDARLVAAQDEVTRLARKIHADFEAMLVAG